MGLLVTVFVAAPAEGAPRERLRAKGIFGDAEPGGAMYVFVEAHVCGPDQALPYAEILVSIDDGKTWETQALAIEGSELQFVQTSPDGLWLAGLHVAEGPGIDPFVLAPLGQTGGQFRWEQREIASGPSELIGVARMNATTSATTNATNLVAWIRPVAVVDLSKRPHRNAIVAYRSEDAGRGWTAIDKKAAQAASSGPFRQFEPIRTASGPWRLVDRSDGGFDVRRREAGKWRTVKELPWTACDAPAAPVPVKHD